MRDGTGDDVCEEVLAALSRPMVGLAERPLLLPDRMNRFIEVHRGVVFAGDGAEQAVLASMHEGALVQLDCDSAGSTCRYAIAQREVILRGEVRLESGRWRVVGR
ncbi:MAG: hypothetical protein JNK82_11855 [Myxococcaceae bacterium]|nr:hypothetical protein [Myxococcaceae bacterium]